jgi:hypothetical protein
MSGTNCFGFQGSGGSGGGGSTGYIDITYDVLYNTIQAGALVPGQKYRLTDYQCLNWLNGTTQAQNNPVPIDPSFNPREIHYSSTEVLLLEATSPFAISPIAYSENYPQDIIEFNPYSNTFGLENSLNISNGASLPDSSIVSGFDLQWDGTNVYFDMPSGYPAYLGQFIAIYCEFNGGADYLECAYYPALNINNSPLVSYGNISSYIQLASGGTRVILTDLGFLDFTSYDTNSLYVSSFLYFADSKGQIVRRQDAFLNIDTSFDFRNQVFRRYEIVTPIGTEFAGIGDEWQIGGTTYTTTGNYNDYPVFYLGASDVTISGLQSDNNVFLGECVQSTLSNAQDNTCLSVYRTQIVEFRRNFFQSIDSSKYFYCSGNLVSNDANNSLLKIYENTILTGFSNNVGHGDFFSNTLNNFSFNTIQNNFYLNNIGSSCSYNAFGFNVNNNVIGTGFSQNVVGDGFTTNTISDNCTNNVFGNSNTNNVLGANYSQNIMGNFFSQNNITANCTLNTFADGFNNNICIIGFRRNNISAGFGFTDFSLATFVYGDYDCNILKMSNGNFILTYTDGTPNLKYDGPNA